MSLPLFVYGTLLPGAWPPPLVSGRRSRAASVLCPLFPLPPRYPAAAIDRLPRRGDRDRVPAGHRCQQRYEHGRRYKTTYLLKHAQTPFENR